MIHLSLKFFDSQHIPTSCQIWSPNTLCKSGVCFQLHKPDTFVPPPACSLAEEYVFIKISIHDVHVSGLFVPFPTANSHDQLLNLHVPVVSIRVWSGTELVDCCTLTWQMLANNQIKAGKCSEWSVLSYQGIGNTGTSYMYPNALKFSGRQQKENTSCSVLQSVVPIYLPPECSFGTKYTRDVMLATENFYLHRLNEAIRHGIWNKRLRGETFLKDDLSVTLSYMFLSNIPSQTGQWSNPLMFSFIDMSLHNPRNAMDYIMNAYHLIIDMCSKSWRSFVLADFVRAVLKYGGHPFVAVSEDSHAHLVLISASKQAELFGVEFRVKPPPGGVVEIPFFGTKTQRASLTFVPETIFNSKRNPGRKHIPTTKPQEFNFLDAKPSTVKAIYGEINGNPVVIRSSQTSFSPHSTPYCINDEDECSEHVPYKRGEEEEEEREDEAREEEKDKLKNEKVMKWDKSNIVDWIQYHYRAPILKPLDLSQTVPVLSKEFEKTKARLKMNMDVEFIYKLNLFCNDEMDSVMDAIQEQGYICDTDYSFALGNWILRIGKPKSQSYFGF